MGTAQKQGELWGARARDWADFGETTTLATYFAVFDRVGVGSGTSLLDLGCGAGLAMKIAHDRGARVAGLDASPALVEIARERLPGVRIDVGDMEALPFDDDSFDVVTGFTSLQFAGDRTRALHEARRVTKPGGSITILVWGRKDDCQSTLTMNALGALLPPPPNPPGRPLGDPGVLEDVMRGAGLKPVDGGEVECPFTFPDIETGIRTMRSPGMVYMIEQMAGADRVVEAIRESLVPFVRPDGSVVQRNRFRWVMARASDD